MLLDELGDAAPARQSWVQNVVARDQGEAFGVQGSGNLIVHQAPTQAAQAPGKVAATGTSTDTDTDTDAATGTRTGTDTVTDAITGTSTDADTDTATDPSASPESGLPS